jgi:hypothetical protein
MRRLQAVNNSPADRVMVVFGGAETPHGRLRKTLPPSIATLLGPFAAADVVLVPTRLLQGVDGDVGFGMSLWRIVCEYAAAGGVVELHSAVINSAMATDTIDLPRLVPDPPPRSWDWLKSAITKTVAKTQNPVERQALLAGLLQIHGWLEDSHAAAQAIEHEGRNRNGDYWHAIMHRREPDYGNAKYWFRQVGRHPVFEPLAREVTAMFAESSSTDVSAWLPRLQDSGKWNPFAFVDLCEACAGDEDSPLGGAAQRVQQFEMFLLLEQTWRDANSA